MLRRHPRLRSQAGLPSFVRRQRSYPPVAIGLHRRTNTLGLFAEKLAQHFRSQQQVLLDNPNSRNKLNVTVSRHIRPGDYLTLLAGVLIHGLDIGDSLVRHRADTALNPPAAESFQGGAAVARTRQIEVPGPLR